MIETTPLRKKLLDLAISGKLVPKTGEWKTVKLGDVCDVRDGTHDSPRYFAQGFPLMTSKNFSKGFEDFSDVKMISKDDFDEINKRSKVDVGDIVMPMIGTIGSPVIIRSERPFAVKNVALIKFRNDSPINRFVKIVLESPYFEGLIAAKNRGNTQKFIALGDLRRAIIPLPPLAEQKAIVKRLEELLALEREIAADNAELDDLITAAKRKILDLAVSGKLVPKTGEWKTAKGREIFEDTESRLPEGEMFDYIDIDSVDNKQHRVIEPKHLLVVNAPSRASRGLRAGDTLFSIVRPYLENIAYIDKKLEHCIASTGFFVCRPKASCDSRYLYTLMTAPYVIKGLNSYMKGDNSPSICKADILNFVFPLPPLAEQKAIVKRVEELFAVLDAMKGT